MVRLVFVGAVILLLVGCSGTAPVKLRTETVEVVRPVLYCPAPDYAKLARPKTLPIDAITPKTPDGEVAVRYKATVKLLQEYIRRLELNLSQYSNTSSALEELQQELGLDKYTN